MTRMNLFRLAGAAMLCVGSGICMPVQAADSPSMDRLPEAATSEAIALAAEFNFTKKGCLPSPAISATGQQNGGLKNSGSNTGGCQRAEQLDFSTPKAGSNTYYRQACLTEDGTEYCANMYALYFLKDQPSPGTGHRHDWEWAMIWTAKPAGATKRTITYGAHSYHHKANVSPVSKVSFGLDSHARFVYDQTGGTTHTMYFYPRSTDNFYNKTQVTPPIVDWYLMKADGASNAKLREMFNTYDYGDANCSFNDNNFVKNVVKAAPDGYPNDPAKWQAAVDAMGG